MSRAGRAAGLSLALVIVVGLVAAALTGPTPSTAAERPAASGSPWALEHLLTYSSAEGAPTADKFTPLSPGTRKRMARATRAGKPWNIVIILTDDQPTGTQASMPTVRRELMGRGVTFPSGLIPTPVCCPSRASLMTGKYAQGTGVYDNSTGGVPGGHKAFIDNGNATQTIAYLLHQRGYRTGLFGKYMNEYGKDYRGFPPPGWNEWLTFTRSSKYSDYEVTQPYGRTDRSRVRAGKLARTPPSRPVATYSTTFFGEAASQFIRTAPKRKPILAVYAPFAPHMPSTPERKYRHTLTDTGWWLTDPSVMESDVSDKPRWVGQTPVSGFIDNAPLGRKLVKQREALLSVDDQVDRILESLRDTRRLSRTVVFFTSDNGYMHGQHRLSRKGVPYRGATEVPLVMRVGNEIETALVDPRPAAANVDITATVLALAGVAQQIDGVSLLGPPGRTGVPVLGVAHEFEGITRPPYCGWRTATELFVRYGSGEEEYYDYTADPFELDNAVSDPAVAARVEELRSATRATCVPAPPDFGVSFDQPSWDYDSYIPPADRDVEE